MTDMAAGVTKTRRMIEDYLVGDYGNLHNWHQALQAR